MPTGAVPMVNNLFQGMPLDPATGLYYERARWYSPSLGTWISQDPAQYINGADTYQFVEGNPVRSTDSVGLAFSYTAAQQFVSQAMPGWAVVSGRAVPPPGPVHPSGTPQTTESGWIYRTYTTTIHGTRTTAYRVRIEDTSSHPPCFQTIALYQTRDVTETIVTNNAADINADATALGVVGGIMGTVGTITALVPGGQAVGIFEGIVGGVMATGGTLLGGIGNIELGAPPPPTIAPGAVIGDSSSP